MKFLTALVAVAVATASLGAHAEFCSTDQLAVATSLTSDAGLLSACPSMANADVLNGVAPCANAGCASYLSSLSGRLPDCDVDEGKSFKDLYAAFVSVCRENAAKAPQSTPTVTSRGNATTNGTATAVPGANSTNTTTPVPTTLVPTTDLPSLNSTNSNSTADGNSTAGSNATAPDSDTVGASTKPAVPAPAPQSLGVRPTLVGVGVVTVTAIAMALVA